MIKRTITGAILAALLAIVAFLHDTVVFPIAIALLSTIGIIEMYRCTGLVKYKWMFIPALFVACAMPICSRMFPSVNVAVISYLGIFYLMLMYYMMCAVFTKKGLDFSDSLVGFGTMFYVIFGFTSLVILGNVKFGVYLVLLVIGAPWISDVGAYIIGRLFGRHKLIPAVSPKKTVEGLIGGVIFCALACLGYGLVIEHFFADEIGGINHVYFIIAGVLISVVSQVGDLIASMIKRKYDVKDYGGIFPGHGGVLDRFDSVLTTAPICLLLVILPIGFEMFATK